MTTTITLNGSAGSQFLAQVGPLYREAMPTALVELLAASASSRASGDAAIVVEPRIADQLAAFVDGVLAEGTVQVTAPPLLFSPKPGDHVMIARDALVELEVPRKASRTWAPIARGTTGRLISRRGDFGRVFLMDGAYIRHYAYVTDRSMTRIRLPASGGV